MKNVNKIIVMLLVIWFVVGIPTRGLYASETDQSVIDLTALTNDQIARKLDKSPKTQDFIILTEEQLKQKSGYKVTEVIANENFSNVNSTMWGEYQVYKINGHFVFCITPGYDTLNTAEKINETGSVYAKFTKSTKTYITRVISSSLDNYHRTKNTGFIFAGQLLIWDYISNNEADVIGNAMESWNPEYLNSWTINNSVYYPQIKVIEKDLGSWTTLPSFLKPSTQQAQAHILKYDKAKDEFAITLKDTNGVWDKKYATYKQIGNYKLSNPAGKDNVRISSSKELTTYSNPVKFSWNPFISKKKELYDAGQDLIYVGAVPVNGYMKFKTEAYPKGGFELKKVGEMPSGSVTALSGVKFKVTGSKYSKVFTTDNDGKISVENELKPGKYHIKEISAPTKYNIGFEQDFVVEPGKTTAINNGRLIVNDLYYNKIRFTKLGDSFVNGDEKTTGLEGVKFDLYKEEGEANQIIDENDELVQELVSNQDGVVESSKLYEGDYIIKEIETLPGYVLEDQTYSFKVSNNGKIINGTTIDLGTVTNSVLTGQIRLKKIGVGSCEQVSKCSIPLKNVKFEIYADSNNNGILDEEELGPVGQIITDSKGVGVSNPLKYGQYFLKETENPHTNYQMSDVTYEFNIEQANQIIDINDGKPIQNSEKTGSLEITKQGESLSNTNEDMQMLAGATYQITDEQGKSIGEVTTNAQGKANFDNLSFGKYRIKEIKAPQGYIVDETVYEFEINDKTYKHPINLIFSDDVIKNKLEISKVDATTKEEVAGAKLVVKDRNTNEIIEEWTSTTDPFKFEINYGQYEICETLAPPGYKQTTRCTNFDVKEDGVNQSFQIVNKQMKMAVTGSLPKRTWIIMLLIAILSILVILYVRILFPRS